MAITRPGIVLLAWYSGTTVAGRPSAASGAMVGTKTRYSSSPVRARARVNSRAYVSDPPTSPGTSVSSEMPTGTGRAYRAVTPPRYNPPMASAGQETRMAAGVLPPEEIDVAALFA